MTTLEEQLKETKQLVSQLELWLQYELEMPGLKVKAFRGNDHMDIEIYGGTIPSSTTMWYCTKNNRVQHDYCKS